MSIRLERFQAFSRRFDRFRDIRPRMGQRQKCGLELRRRKVYSAFEHGAEKIAELHGIRRLGAREVLHLLIREE